MLMAQGVLSPQGTTGHRIHSCRPWPATLLGHSQGQAPQIHAFHSQISWLEGKDPGISPCAPTVQSPVPGQGLRNPSDPNPLAMAFQGATKHPAFCWQPLGGNSTLRASPSFELGGPTFLLGFIAVEVGLLKLILTFQ